MRTTLRQRLRLQPLCLGLAACVMRSPEIVTVTRSCGFDCLLIDTEHGPIGIGDAASLCVTAWEAGLPSLVRVGGPTHPDLARVLDCGAEGVVVPHVETAEEARLIVEKCRFQPVGRRSLPSPLVRLGFRVPPAAEMMRRIEEETLVVLMIESARGVANAEAIAAVPGVDVLMVGANDLAADMGHVGAVDHPEVLAAFAAIARAAHAHGKVFSVIGVAEALLPSHAHGLGTKLIIATNDINLLIDGGLATVARLSAPDA
ncbi:MAG: aldolase [Beijerinckiaceae bacterium]|nr:aldolase [Beijerinckiaceae bacterium]